MAGNDEFQKYFDDKKTFYDKLIEFLENSEASDSDFNRIIELINETKCTEDHKEFKFLLHLLINLSNNHFRQTNFISNIEKIFLNFVNEIKQTFSNYEIFNIFQSNKLILLFLIEKKILTIDEKIYHEILNKRELNGLQYFHFFIPEMKEFIGEGNFKDIEKEIISQNPYIYDNYENKRKIGENDSYICSLIRQDSIEEFIIYINKANYPLSNPISPSIFETNLFLIENNPTLIEYAFYFGSIQIINYLILNRVELTSSLFIYAIHSNNSEVIYLLESNDIKLFSKSYENCFLESIKCHHNDVANYFLTNYLNDKKTILKSNVVKTIFKYNNYSFIPKDFDDNYIVFFYLCYFNYSKMIKFLLNKDEYEIRKSLISNKLIFKNGILLFNYLTGLFISIIILHH